ncbi:MAG: dihydroneopterin aldolase [Ginsengibacter sp.]
MITIHLHNLIFYAYHGIHEEEKILGNEFDLSADIQFHEEHEVITSIKQTINYVDVYKIIQQRMNIPSALLETVIMDIGIAIKKRYDNVRSISINLKKVHPPITGFQGGVSVSWQKEF